MKNICTNEQFVYSKLKQKQKCCTSQKSPKLCCIILLFEAAPNCCAPQKKNAILVEEFGAETKKEGVEPGIKAMSHEGSGLVRR